MLSKGDSLRISKDKVFVNNQISNK